jgi:hypothetical protein
MCFTRGNTITLRLQIAHMYRREASFPTNRFCPSQPSEVPSLRPQEATSKRPVSTCVPLTSGRHSSKMSSLSGNVYQTRSLCNIEYRRKCINAMCGFFACNTTSSPHLTKTSPQLLRPPHGEPSLACNPRTIRGSHQPIHPVASVYFHPLLLASPVRTKLSMS